LELNFCTRMGEDVEHQIETIAQDVLNKLLEQRAITADMRVLVVEDDPNDAFLAKRPLTRLGLNVDVAETAEQALDKLLRDPTKPRYVMVFLDLKLPDHDGIYVLRNVREAMPGLPVAIMTGQDVTSELVRRAIQLGYYGFVHKPLNNEVAVEIMAKHNLPIPKGSEAKNGDQQPSI
jgi:DNA-binding NtrC family response regulator